MPAEAPTRPDEFDASRVHAAHALGGVTTHGSVDKERSP